MRQKDKVIRDYLQGLTITVISKKRKTTKQYISQIISRYKLEQRVKEVSN